MSASSREEGEKENKKDKQQADQWNGNIKSNNHNEMSSDRVRCSR